MCQRREPTNKTCSFLPPLFGPLSFSFSQNRKIQGLKNLEQRAKHGKIG